MKNFYLTLVFLVFGFFGSAQTSTEVGITEGQLSVSLSGGANYTIPIAVPPGINGVVPQISLVYNSQGGNGIAGYGWNISGVSSISRIPATKFHDNTVDGVDFNTLDRFALDGQRLIVKNGTNGVYGANGTVYETESFSNIKVTSFGINPLGAKYGPAYFLVEYPDGSKAYYGNSANSCSAMEWGINYWENPQGVRISYSYSLLYSILNLVSIKYGSITTATPINEIQFVYNPRQQVDQAYIGGLSLIQSNLLKQIKVVSNNVGFRNYILAHDQSSLGYDRLTSVTEKSGDNTKSYDPTVFSYGSKDVVITSKSTTTSLGLGDINSQNSATVSGDFDGDGQMDFVVYPTIGLSQKKIFWVFTSLKNNTAGSTPYTVECGSFEEIFPTNSLSSNGKMMPEQGIAVVQMSVDNRAVRFNVYRRSLGVVALDYTKQVAFPERENCADFTTMRAKKYLSGDFNGDGLTDVVAIDTPLWNSCGKSPIGKAYFIDLDRRKSSNFWNEAGTIIDFKAEDKLEAFDVNGDGKTDVIHFSKGIVSVYTINDNNQLVLLWKTLDADINTTFAILPGDYNGDGKMDFIIPKSEGIYSDNSYAKFLSTGVGFIKTVQTYGFRNLGSSTDKDAIYISNLIPLDFNGDGKTDMVHFRAVCAKNGSAGRIIIKSFQNNGSTFNDSYEFDTGLTKENLTAIKTFPIPVFLSPNKNNQYLGVGAISNNLIYSFDLQKDFSKENLISAITTGNGVRESITYSPLQQDQYEPFYTPTILTESFPNVDIITAPNFKIVTKLEKKSTNTYKKQLFNYSGAVFNAQGLGFLGFRTTMRTNWHDENETSLISTVSKNDISKRGANIESFSVLGYATTQTASSNYITKTSLNNSAVLLSNRVYKLSNLNTTEYNSLENSRKVTTKKYDPYNNILENLVEFYDGNTWIRSDITDIEYENQLTGPVYFVGRPAKKLAYPASPGNVSPKSEEKYTYTNHLLTKITKILNTSYATNITEDNTYDAVGNITQKLITATGLAPRKTSYAYDISGRFLTQSTDIEGLSTKFIYNSDGTLKSETNPYGLTTSYEYDSWFKKTKTIDYLLKSNNYKYTRMGEKTIVTTTGDDGSASEEIFDDLGRKIKSGIKEINGNFSYVSYLYDTYDRNYKVSEPYIGTAPTQWNETKYDNYGRVYQTIDFRKKTIDIAYLGLTTIVNDNGKIKETTKNAVGNVKSVKDSPGGTISYNYFANGHLQTTYYDGVTTTIEEDPYGRRSKLIDPSAGTYTYEYNTLGETVKETAPNGTTTYTRDAFGKITQKTITGINTNSKTTYTYDSASKLLTSTKFEDFTNGTNAITNGYTYDGYKRIINTVETTPFATFTKALSYDVFGRINTETATAAAGGKTSAKVIKNSYKNGYHWQILDNATSAVLWQVNTINAKGQLLTAQSGPTTITKAYEDGFVTQYKYDKTADATNILTLNTVFDPKKGNLTSRTNNMFNWNESFKYDSLDRLTDFINTQGKQETQFYDDKGRITKNNLGTYNYLKTAKPYQNTSVTVTPEALTYYTAKPKQIITYNTFKSPVQIEEEGIDKISFDYNDENSRTAMFYGGLQIDKLQRPLQKYYSADGTMEIKKNITTGVFEFVTYIGGDGYSAPIVVKSNGTTQNYLYLQRDYQGSILGITDANGTVVEKRLFDAWGAIISVKDGAGNTLAGLTILDRGYTGHEHLQSVGLINMNGRIYDPKLHRFLQPDNYVQDPYNTQNYNRYSYVLNNPLKFTDFSGETWWSDNWKQVVTVGVVVVVAVVVTYATAGMASPLAASMITGAAAGFAGGATGSALEGNSFGQVMFDGGFGAIKGGVFGAAGGYAASFAPAGIFNGAAYSLATNVTLNGIGNVIEGRDPFENVGVTAAISIVTGGYQGYKAAQAQGLNPVTGGPKPSVIAKGANSFTKDAQIAYDKAVRAQQEPINMSSTAVADTPIEFKTSSISMAPSRNYTIFDAEGELFKFGVTDANFNRMNQSLKMAGEGATAKFSDVLPKFQAHINETYMRSLHFNSTKVWDINGMRYPYPRNFDTGVRINPIK